MPDDPRKLGGGIANSIPGVQPLAQGLDWLGQNAVDPLMAILQQYGILPQAAPPINGPLPQFGGLDANGQPIVNQPPGQPGPGGLRGRMLKK